MRKFLCIAVFSIAFMANATEKNENVANDFKEVNIEKSDFYKEIKTANSDVEMEIFEDAVFFGCGSQGNAVYEEYRDAGMSHRDARAERRAWVRDCRGNGPDGWLSIFISFGF